MPLPSKSNEEASWTISIDAECPECEDSFDITQADDFWTEFNPEIGEHGTDRTENVEVICSHCEHEFKVDFVY